MRRVYTKSAFSMLLLLAGSAVAPAQEPVAPAARRVAIGPQYKAGGLHRSLWGDDYRALWTKPIEVEVLDLATFAGGLTPVLRVGGQQTKGLAMRGADGRDYTFRGVDKDPTSILPEDLRDTWVRGLVQDQIAASSPSAFLVVDELMDAAGILHTKTRLVAMPDDPRLGEFRKEFAGLVGQISEYPGAKSDRNPGFQGALEILKHGDFYTRLAAGHGDRADARAFLKARLFDLMIGDWDRHRDQWRWAKFPDQPLWQPMPDDRDQAFSRYDGLVPGLARPRAPFFQSYHADYPKMKGLTWNGREQDRQLLAGLERQAYKDAAVELQSRITDAVIDKAAAAAAAGVRRARRGAPGQGPQGAPRPAGPRGGGLLRAPRGESRGPPERCRGAGRDRAARRRHAGARLGTGVRRESGRRAHLRQDAPREGDGRSAGVPGRRQRPCPDDGQGERHPGSRDRDGGAGRRGRHAGRRHALQQRRRGREAPGRSRLAPRRSQVQPPPPPEDTPWIRPRGWGRDTFFSPWLAYGSDLGLFVGVAADTKGFGFRKDPYSNRHSIRAGWAFGEQSFRLDYRAEFRIENRGWYWGWYGYASGVDASRYFGFGNETSDAGDPNSDFYKTKHNDFAFTPTLALPLASDLTFFLGPTVRYGSNRDPDAGTLAQPGAALRLRRLRRSRGDGGHCTRHARPREAPGQRGAPQLRLPAPRRARGRAGTGVPEGLGRRGDLRLGEGQRGPLSEPRLGEDAHAGAARRRPEALRPLSLLRGGVSRRRARRASAPRRATTRCAGCRATATPATRAFTGARTCASTSRASGSSCRGRGGSWVSPTAGACGSRAKTRTSGTPATAGGSGSPGSTAPTRSAQPTREARVATRSTSTPGSLSDGFRKASVSRLIPKLCHSCHTSGAKARDYVYTSYAKR